MEEDDSVEDILAVDTLAVEDLRSWDCMVEEELDNKIIIK